MVTGKTSTLDLAKVIGKSRSYVSNCLRLLKLPERTKSLLRDCTISAGHVRALPSSAEPDALAEKIVSQGLSVRDVAQEILAAENDSSRNSPSRREASSRNSLHARSTSARSLLMLPMVIRIAYRSLILVCGRNASPQRWRLPGFGRD